MEQNKDHSGAAVRGESVAEMQLVPKFAGQFNTHQEWVNKAQSWLKSPGYRPAMCVDVKGRRMSNGGDMGKARDEGTFPVRFFWECELAPVSARAADALDSQPTVSDGWISVKDRLPELGQTVLAVNNEYGQRESKFDRWSQGSINRANYGEEAGYFNWQEPMNNWGSSWKPTHWMPLPPAPASSQPTEGDGCDECRHTYCLSGEICRHCGDVNGTQGWKGGRQPTDGGVRNG